MKKQWYYKIITALVALLVIPALLFLPILQLHVVASVVSVDFKQSVDAKWIFHFAKDKQTGNEALDKYLSGNGDVSKIWENMGSIHTRITIYVVAVVLSVLFALAIIALVFVLKQKKGKLWVLALSGAGLLSSITASAAFSSIAAPLLNGTIKLGTLLGIGSIADGFINLERFTGGSAVPVVLLLFLLLMIIVTVFLALDYMNDNKEKKHKPSQRKKTAKR
ncbi:MAG: hypothetical protein LBJ12_08055 [Oscillospiraceae bacterium]|jgi:hypothetical protein|nr:hypothetical protein [Oscillospiraceae bacterium]